MKMKLKKTEKGYESIGGRFQYIKCKVASHKNGSWRNAWRLMDKDKQASDDFEDKLEHCKDIAEGILEDEI